MTRHFLWNEHAELLTKPLATALMDLRREDGDNDADATTHEVLNPEVAEWKKKLTTAETMDELVDVWKTMPANLREPLKFVKDNAKARLSAPIKEAA